MARPLPQAVLTSHRGFSGRAMEGDGQSGQDKLTWDLLQFGHSQARRGMQATAYSAAGARRVRWNKKLESSTLPKPMDLLHKDAAVLEKLCARFLLLIIRVTEYPAGETVVALIDPEAGDMKLLGNYPK